MGGDRVETLKKYLPDSYAREREIEKLPWGSNGFMTPGFCEIL